MSFEDEYNPIATYFEKLRDGLSEAVGVQLQLKFDPPGPSGVLIERSMGEPSFYSEFHTWNSPVEESLIDLADGLADISNLRKRLRMRLQFRMEPSWLEEFDENEAGLTG